MKQNRREFLKIAGMGVLGAGIGTVFPGSKAIGAPLKDVPSTPIKMGVIAFLSGQAALAGVPALHAHEIWAEQVNQTGGILGRKVELIVEEEAGVKETVDKFKKLTLKDKCDVVIGTMSTANCLALAKDAEMLKQIFMSHGGTTQNGMDETIVNPVYAFRSCDNEAPVVACAMLTAKMFPNIKKVAGINEDYSYGRNCWEAYERTLKIFMPNVKFEPGIWTKFGETEFMAAIDALDAQKPDLIFSSFWTGTISAFLKQSAAKKLFQKYKGCFPTAGLAKDALKKEFTPEGLLIGYDVFYWLDTDSDPRASQFCRRYMEKYKTWPEPTVEYAYNCCQSYKAAIEKSYALLGKWPTKGQIASCMGGISVPTLAGYHGFTKDNRMLVTQFSGLSSHRNPFDYVTLEPYYRTPPVQNMKPEGYTFDQWEAEWVKKRKERDK